MSNSRSGGFSRTITCYGILGTETIWWNFRDMSIAVLLFLLGFIRFLEGYYMILITRRSQVARIGYHRIYKIDETSMVSITNEDIKKVHPDESKWDSTERLDWIHLIPLLKILTCIPKSWPHKWILLQVEKVFVDCPKYCVTCHTSFIFSYTYDLTHTLQFNFTSQNQVNPDEVTQEHMCFGTRYEPTWKFVWNEYLLQPLKSQVHSRWLLWIIHGTTNF